MRPAFRMPPLPVGRWFDGDGHEIAYGERWGMGGPPDDAYSRVTHPERYAPLHDVGDALVQHLLAEYDCVGEEDEPVQRELRALRLHPLEGSGGIRIAWTDFPGVLADLGGEVPEAAPMCGCDACDEPLERAAEQFCDRVLSAVASASWPLRTG